MNEKEKKRDERFITEPLRKMRSYQSHVLSVDR